MGGVPIAELVLGVLGVLLTSVVSITGLILTRDPYRRVRQAAEVSGLLPDALAEAWRPILLAEVADVLSLERSRKWWSYAALSSNVLAVGFLAVVLFGDLTVWWLVVLSSLFVLLQWMALFGWRVSVRRSKKQWKRVEDHMDRSLNRGVASGPGSGQSGAP